MWVQMNCIVCISYVWYDDKEIVLTAVIPGDQSIEVKKKQHYILNNQKELIADSSGCDRLSVQTKSSVVLMMIRVAKLLMLLVCPERGT